MSTTTQAAVFGAIEAKHTEAKLTLVLDAKYANTGTAYAVGDGSLDAVGHRLRYDFQRGHSIYFTHTSGGNAAAVWSETGGTASWVCPSLDDLVSRVVALLEAR